MSSDRSPARSLADIAATLGVPVSDFYGLQAVGVAKRAELFGIWAAIRDEADRDRLLAFARALAERPPASDKIAAE